MKRRIALLTGVSLGAALMYVLDPVLGRRRRALIRDRVAHLRRRTGRAAGVTRRDIANRARGLQFETIDRMKRGELGVDRLPRIVRRTSSGLVFRRVWPPAVRVAAGSAGALLALQGIHRRTAAGIAAAAAGTALLARSITNVPMRRLTGIGAGDDAVVVQKAIHINAPVDRVFDVWSRYERFPEFMAHVREVRLDGPDRSHWVVAGPAGIPIEWEAVTTEFVPNQFLAWRTAPGSIVRHSGAVRFDEENGGTRVTVRMSYNPGTGVVGHALAGLFGADPKSQMDRDLVMMKTFIESGRQPHMAIRARSSGNGAHAE